MELGAFVNHAGLRERILIIADDKRRKDKSFIRMGPLRLLETKASKNSIIWYPYQDGDLRKLENKVKNEIKRIAQTVRVEPGFESPIIAARFMLALISVLAPINKKTIAECIKHLASLGAPEVEIVCSGALVGLFRQKAIFLDGNRYNLSPSGHVLLSSMLRVG